MGALNLSMSIASSSEGYRLICAPPWRHWQPVDRGQRCTAALPQWSVQARCLVALSTYAQTSFQWSCGLHPTFTKGLVVLLYLGLLSDVSQRLFQLLQRLWKAGNANAKAYTGALKLKLVADNHANAKFRPEGHKISTKPWVIRKQQEHARILSTAYLS